MNIQYLNFLKQLPINQPLYNHQVVLMYYSKSKDLYPGMGSGESIKKERKEDFKELSKIKDWRKKLSNFHIQPFTYDGLTWNSVEHLYQASKFRKNNPDFYKLFSIESGTEISKNPEMAKSAGSKSGKYKGQQLRPKNIFIDKDFFDKDNKVMFNALYAKFSQNKDLLDVLKKTRNAKLIHFMRSNPYITMNDLMRVRQVL